MYSQAHIGLFNIYWQVWLLVIRGPEKGNLGSLEAFSNVAKIVSAFEAFSSNLVSEVKPFSSMCGKATAQAALLDN